MSTKIIDGITQAALTLTGSDEYVVHAAVLGDHSRVFSDVDTPYPPGVHGELPVAHGAGQVPDRGFSTIPGD